MTSGRQRELLEQQLRGFSGADGGDGAGRDLLAFALCWQAAAAAGAAPTGDEDPPPVADEDRRCIASLASLSEALDADSTRSAAEACAEQLSGQLLCVAADGEGLPEGEQLRLLGRRVA